MQNPVHSVVRRVFFAWMNDVAQLGCACRALCAHFVNGGARYR